MHCLIIHSRWCLTIALSCFIFSHSPAYAQLQAATTSSDQQASAKTMLKVRKELASLLGLRLETLLPDTDLIANLGVDRAMVHYKLLSLYAIFKVSPPTEELTVIRQISNHIDDAEVVYYLSSDDLKEEGTRDVGADEFFIQKVYFATNRKATGKPAPDEFFGSEPTSGRQLHYGLASVNIPRSHKSGRLETPWLGMRWLQNRSKHIFIGENLKILDAARFYASINAEGAGKEPVLIYIHGFNIDFGEAIIRAAQVAVDLNFNGVPVAFSWPSNGKANPLAYWSDMADVEVSVDYIERFLIQMRNKFADRTIHVIAHSLGAKALTFALRNLARRGHKGPMFSSVILAAPDLDSRLFADSMALEIKPLASHWAIYASQNDFALNYSGVLSGTPLLGIPLTIVNGMQIIDASKIEVTPWSVPEGHSYYATKKKVIDDMIGVLNGLLPKTRGLVAKTHKNGVAWEFR